MLFDSFLYQKEPAGNVPVTMIQLDYRIKTGSLFGHFPSQFCCILAIQNEQRCASVQVRTPQIPCDIPTMAQPVYEGTSDGSLGALDEKNITTFEPRACIAYLIFLVLFRIAHVL